MTVPANKFSPGTNYDLLVTPSTCLDVANDAHWNTGRFVHVKTADRSEYNDAPRPAHDASGALRLAAA